MRLAQLILDIEESIAKEGEREQGRGAERQEGGRGWPGDVRLRATIASVRGEDTAGGRRGEGGGWDLDSNEHAPSHSGTQES